MNCWGFKTGRRQITGNLWPQPRRFVSGKRRLWHIHGETRRGPWFCFYGALFVASSQSWIVYTLGATSATQMSGEKASSRLSKMAQQFDLMKCRVVTCGTRVHPDIFARVGTKRKTKLVLGHNSVTAQECRDGAPTSDVWKAHIITRQRP